MSIIGRSWHSTVAMMLSAFAIVASGLMIAGDRVFWVSDGKMQTLLKFAALLLNWPVTGAVTIVIFISIFRRPLETFLSRVSKAQVGTWSLEAANASVQQAKAGDPIKIDPDGSPAVNDSSVDILKGQLAELQKLYLFEHVYNLIYGSQIKLLKHLLQFHHTGVSKGQLVIHHLNHQAQSGQFASTWEAYIGFLQSFDLVMPVASNNDILTITALGSEFVHYIQDKYPSSMDFKHG